MSGRRWTSPGVRGTFRTCGSEREEFPNFLSGKVGCGSLAAWWIDRSIASLSGRPVVWYRCGHRYGLYRRESLWLSVTWQRGPGGDHKSRFMIFGFHSSVQICTRRVQRSLHEEEHQTCALLAPCGVSFPARSRLGHRRSVIRRLGSRPASRRRERGGWPPYL